MKHQAHVSKLGRGASHRWAMLRTMVTQLLEHERIETTLPRAKELRRLADSMITLGKEGGLNARRKAAGLLRDDRVIHKLFTTMAERYRDRPGGYTRVLQAGRRTNDAAPMGIIEAKVQALEMPDDAPNMHRYVDREGELRPARPQSLWSPAAQAAVEHMQQKRARKQQLQNQA